MSIIGRVKAGASQRSTSTLSNPAQWLIEALTGGATDSGEVVNPKTAIGLPAFWRGVNVLSGSVGQLPCKVYRPTATGRDLAPRGSRAWTLLHDKPNGRMEADEFWSLVVAGMATWGNHYSWKERGGDGRIANIWPLDPSRVTVKVAPDWTPLYVIDGNMDGAFSSFDILHFRGPSNDGIVGHSPVGVMRQTLGSALARQKFRGRFWANDATPGVTLIHPDKLKPEAIERIRALWDDRHKGAGKARATAVLGEAIDVKQMTMPLQDAQFIEQERFSATEVAQILGLPPYMLAGDNGGNSLTYTTTEAQSLDFIRWTLGPILVRLAKTVTNDGTIMPSPWFAEFESGALLRATTMERYSAWAVAPHLLIDEMREMDNLPPLPDGAGQVLSNSTPVASPDNVKPSDPAQQEGTKK